MGISMAALLAKQKAYMKEYMTATSKDEMKAAQMENQKV